MRPTLAALAAALATSLVACSTAQPSEPLQLPPPSQLPRSATSHAVVLVMENKSYEQVMQDSGSTYFRALASRYALPRHMFGIRHPSLPNYLALIGGDTFKVTENCTDCHFKPRNLAEQLDSRGYTWRAYMEGVPKRCFKGANHGLYAKKHNPFMYFDSILNSPERCANVVPYKRLGSDLRNGALPDFAFITPDLCNDTHDCSIATGDDHLEHIVPAILRELGPRGLLFVTWDEGADERGCCDTAAGGRIATVVAGPDVKTAATAPNARYTHYSTLRTIEEAFGLPLLRKANHPKTRAMGALLKRTHVGALRKPAR